nr:MAG TPA: hypothetical protein [Caudoviricetes sp.]
MSWPARLSLRSMLVVGVVGAAWRILVPFRRCGR